MKTTCVLVAGWMVLGMAAAAAGPSKQVDIQASMLVDGTIAITPDGHVTSFKIDRTKALPTAVTNLLDASIPHWRFDPVLRDGKPVAAQSAMHIRVLAKPIGKDRYSIHLGGAWFGDGHSKGGVHFNGHQERPRYPGTERLMHVYGTVYLLLRVDRDGHPDKVAVQEVDLMVRGAPSQMEQWRKDFSRSALEAARQWTFTPPTTGKQALEDHWFVRIPVAYRMRDRRLPEHIYGRWQPYIPGPRQFIPWADPRQLASGDLSALPAGSISTAGEGLQRIQAPNG